MQIQAEHSCRWIGVIDALSWVAQRLLAESRWKGWLALVVTGSVAGAIFTADFQLLLLPLIVCAFILWVTFVPTSCISQSLTDWLMLKLVRHPDPAKLSHKVIYFMLSVLSIAPALYFVGSGGILGQ